MKIANGVASPVRVADAYGRANIGYAAEAQYLGEYGIPEITVGQYFGVRSGMSAWTPYGGNTIYVNAYYFSDNSLDQSQALVMHELLHDVFGLDDTGIQVSLGLSTGPSENITQWLLNNCIK